MGFQFESLVLNNRKQLHRLLGIHPEEIVCENSFYQRKTSRHPGCQIDYMVQTKFGTLYVCEIKFSKKEISLSIIPEVQAKIAALHYPTGFSCRPVLIQINGVSEDVVDSDYFATIINMSELLYEDQHQSL